MTDSLIQCGETTFSSVLKKGVEIFLTAYVNQIVGSGSGMKWSSNVSTLHWQSAVQQQVKCFLSELCSIVPQNRLSFVEQKVCDCPYNFFRSRSHLIAD